LREGERTTFATSTGLLRTAPETLAEDHININQKVISNGRRAEKKR